MKVYTVRSDGRVLTPGLSFDLDGVRFTPLWCSQLSDDELAKIGIDVTYAPDPPPPPSSFTPVQIVDALEAWGKAKHVISKMGEVDRVRFAATPVFKEDDPWLLSMLNEAGKTIADLKVAVAG